MFKYFKKSGFMLLFFLASCSSNSIVTDEVKSYLDAKEIEYENICVENGIANWNMLSNEGAIDLETPKKKYEQLFFDKKLNGIIDELYAGREKISDRLFKARIEKWHTLITGGKVDFSPELVRLRSKLELWISGNAPKESIPSQDVINDSMKTLMRMRNAKAKWMGFPNYAYMVHELSGLGYDWFINMINTIEKETEKPYKELLAKVKADLGNEKITMYDVNMYLSKIRPKAENMQGRGKISKDKVIELMKESTRNIGIDPEKLPVRFVENKMPYGGNGIAVKVPDDFRIVLLPGMGVNVWMHELGHGLQAMFTKTSSPVLRCYEWCLGSETQAYAEGMAETNAAFANNALWKKKYYGEEPKETVADDYSKYQAAVSLRRTIAGFIQAIEYYARIDEDLTAVKNEINKKYMLLEFNETNKVYMTSMYDVSYPVYMQNYFIAGIIAWQIHEALEKKFGKEYVFNKEVGKYLADNFWQYGTEYTWQERMKMGTGRELDIIGYLASRGIK